MTPNGPAPELSPAQVLALYPAHQDTIPSFLWSRLSKVPDQPLIEFEDRIWTYAAVDAASSALAAAFHSLGVGHGDRICLIAANSDMGVLIFLAAAKLGAVYVPTNPALTDTELDYVLKHSRPTLVIAQAADVQRTAKLLATSPAMQVRSLDDFVGPAPLSATTIAAHIAALAPSISAMPSVPAMPAVRAEDAAIVIYTSGTTGFPKGVVHSHRNYVLAAEAFVARLNLQPQERLLTVLPFFHINALFYSLGGAIATGGTVITTARFSATDFWHLAARSRATQFNILASIGNILGQRSRSEFNNAHRIRKIYGGPISAETFRWFEDDFHIPLLIEGFGMSEIPGACCNPYAGPHKFGSIGKPAVHPRFPGRFVEMRIEDEQGFVLPTGQIGELVVKTPMLFSQYLDDPAQTAAAFRDGWFLTGDLARVDDDGYFYYVARKKDIIRRRGENIAGAELDRVLSSHPSVIEAATIGVPAELGDEEILAAVIVKPGQTLQAEELAAWCADKLAAMKIPRYIVFVDALPHTPSHRVAKHRLKSNPDLLRSAYDRQAPLNGK